MLGEHTAAPITSSDADTADERYKREVKANKIVWESNVFIAFQASMLSSSAVSVATQTP